MAEGYQAHRNETIPKRLSRAYGGARPEHWRSIPTFEAGGFTTLNWQSRTTPSGAAEKISLFAVVYGSCGVGMKLRQCCELVIRSCGFVNHLRPIASSD